MKMIQIYSKTAAALFETNKKAEIILWLHVLSRVPGVIKLPKNKVPKGEVPHLLKWNPETFAENILHIFYRW